MPHERILMKYTVMGFSQPKLVELGLDLSDALILRWFVDFYATGRMHKIIAPSGETFVQVSYKAMIEDIPIIGVGSPNNLRRRMSKLVEAGVMEHYTFRSGGTFSCYRLTEAYESLVSGPDTASVGGTPQKAEGYAPKGVGGTPQKAEQKNPSINNPSTKSDIPPTPSRGNCDFEALMIDLPEERKIILREWLAYKRERRQTYKPIGFKKLLASTTNATDASLRMAVDKSIRSNWSGLFIEQDADHDYISEF
jgi:hypothetical protein